PSLCDAQKDRCESLLRERCINGLLKFIEQCQSFPVGEGQELHQDDPGNAASGINPEEGIAETCPSEATGTPSSWYRLSGDHEAEAPFFHRSGEEFSIVGELRYRRIEWLHIEIANRIRGHQPDRFGLEHGAPINATFVQDDSLEGKII